MSDRENLTKVFAPRVLGRAVSTFDSSMTTIVSVCWGAAMLALVFALYTVNLSVKSKQEAAESVIKEPVLPLVVKQGPDVGEMKVLLDRLQKSYPEITFALDALGSNLTVLAADGSRFRLWLTALSYIDTLAPQYQWSIKEFCVGMKCGSVPMRAILEAQRVSFSLPASE